MIVDAIVNQPVIEAERFLLRPVRKSDLGLLRMYTGDARVARFTRSIPHPLPPGATEAFIARARADGRAEDVWVMDGAEHGFGEVMGVIGLKRLERQQSEIGYWVAPHLWNTGIASEAVRALVAANPQSVSAIFAEVFQDNPISARVLTNNGFAYLGDSEGFCVARASMVKTWTYSRNMG